MDPLVILEVLRQLKGVGGQSAAVPSAEAAKVAGTDAAQDEKIAGLEARVATLERCVKLMASARAKG